MSSTTTPFSRRSKTKAKPSKSSARGGSAKPKSRFTIYVSGDMTSKAIVQLMIDKGVQFERQDIRKHIPGEGARDLIFLQQRGLVSVPQLFSADGKHIGGFEEARLLLVRLPDPTPGLLTA